MSAAATDRQLARQLAVPPPSGASKILGHRFTARILGAQAAALPHGEVDAVHAAATASLALLGRLDAAAVVALGGGVFAESVGCRLVALAELHRGNTGGREVEARREAEVEARQAVGVAAAAVARARREVLACAGRLTGRWPADELAAAALREAQEEAARVEAATEMVRSSPSTAPRFAAS